MLMEELLLLTVPEVRRLKREPSVLCMHWGLSLRVLGG